MAGEGTWGGGGRGRWKDIGTRETYRDYAELTKNMRDLLQSTWGTYNVGRSILDL